MIKELFDIGKTVYCIDWTCDNLGSRTCDEIFSKGLNCSDCKVKRKIVVKRKVLGIEIDGCGTFYQTDMSGIYHEDNVFGSREAAEAEAEKQNRRNNND